jgi:menaquinone-dependent protoporphyrinogen oxidase
MGKKVLVAYASKLGATAEIAKRIRDLLTNAGLEVDLFPAQQVKDLSAYDGIVLGSAIYYGRWRKEAVRFLKTKEDQLRNKKVWFFSSGPLDKGDPVELLDGWTFPPLQQALKERIRPQGLAIFHGVLDRSKLNPFERFVMDKMGAPEGDFRDWGLVEDWTKAIAQAFAG